MECHQLFNSNQHGFRGGHACLCQLLNHFDKVTWFLEHGKPVDVVYLDFTKAFDKTDIGITLRKLKSLGIQGETGRWLTDFLTNHKQTVLVDARKSVPQRVVQIMKPNFRKADFSSLRCEIRRLPKSGRTDVEQKWFSFKTEFMKAQSSCIPQKKNNTKWNKTARMV